MGDDDQKDKIHKPKRKYLKGEFSTFCDIAVKSVEQLKNTVNEIESGNIQEAVDKLHDTETEGDIVRNRIIKSFALDKHPPALQLDRMELLNQIETIINKSEHAGFEIETSGKYYPKSFISEIKTIMDKVVITVKSVSKGVKILFDSFEDAEGAVRTVEKVRDEIRVLVFDLQRKVLDDSSTTHQNLFAVNNISVKVSSIAEKAKETADLMAKMKLKYL